MGKYGRKGWETLVGLASEVKPLHSPQPTLQYINNIDKDFSLSKEHNQTHHKPL
jgi:hypothetical protein